MNKSLTEKQMVQLPADKMIPLDHVRSRLATLWLGAAGTIILILVVQSLRQVYGPAIQEVWGWILPTLMPTLGLIVTVLGYTALDPAVTEPSYGGASSSLLSGSPLLIFS